MAKKTSGRMSGRLIYAATVVAILGVTAGVSLGAFLTPAPVNQSASYFQGTSGGVPNYASPTLQISHSGGASCSSGTVTDRASAGTVDITLSAWSGASNCTAGDFTEEFTLAYNAASVSYQNNTLAISTQVGSNPVGTNSVTLSVGTGTTGAFTATVHVYVDYGGATLQAAGITSLTILLD